jgi:hypothetical protein
VQKSLAAFFHSSPVLQGGRRTGAKATETQPRDYSKKHKKRKLVKEGREKEKEQIKTKSIQKQKSAGLKEELDSPDIMEYITKLQER